MSEAAGGLPQWAILLRQLKAEVEEEKRAKEKGRRPSTTIETATRRSESRN